MIWLFIHKKGQLAKFWVVFPITVRIFDPEYHCQAYLRFAFVMLCLVFMKFRKLKSLHQENRKLHSLKTFTFKSLNNYSIWQKLSSKCYSEFFIDVIRKELGKSLLLSNGFPYLKYHRRNVAKTTKTSLCLPNSFPSAWPAKKSKRY